MSSVDHYGSGNFGYKIVWKNGITAYSWFKTEEQRDAAFKDSKKKDANKLTLKKVKK